MAPISAATPLSAFSLQRSTTPSAVPTPAAALPSTWPNVAPTSRRCGPVLHGPSKIAGETRFVLDFRSIDDATMRRMRDLSLSLAGETGRYFRVRFALGDELISAPAALDPAMQARFAAIAQPAPSRR